MEKDWQTIENWIHEEGFTHKEIKSLYEEEKHRRVVGVNSGPTIDVYDLSVEKHKCFATDSVIMHNCQKDEEGNVFKVLTANTAVKKEVEFLFRNRNMLNLNRHSWTWFKNLCIFGDWFPRSRSEPRQPERGHLQNPPAPAGKYVPDRNHQGQTYPSSNRARKARTTKPSSVPRWSVRPPRAN
jgi:hypothetical protein